MPKDARLSDEESDIVTKFLSEKWTKPECPFHGPTTWNIDKIVGQILPYHGGSLVVGGPVFPLVIVTCATCGYSVLINAIRAGAVKPDGGPGGKTPPYYRPTGEPDPTTAGSSGDA